MPKENARNPNTSLPQFRADLRSLSYVLGFSMLLIFTAVTIGARDENTKALLLSNQRAASNGERSMTVPPEPKLSYNGPLYLGNDAWNADGQVLSSAAPANAGKPLAYSGKQLKQKRLTDSFIEGEKEAGLSPHRAHPQHAEHTKSFLRKEAPGLAKDVNRAVKDVKDIASKVQDVKMAAVDSVGEMASSAKSALNNIGATMAQGFNIQDHAAHPKTPVKVLSHV